MESQARGHVLPPHRVPDETKWVKRYMHVTNYTTLLFFVNSLLSIIIKATAVLFRETKT